MDSEPFPVRTYLPDDLSTLYRIRLQTAAYDHLPSPPCYEIKLLAAANREDRAVHFSEVYSVALTTDDDWFDTYLPADSKLCIDPFLIYESTKPNWQGAHDRILDFFAMTFELIRRAKGDRNSPAWRQAQHLLLFPEPAEFCLGVAEGSSLGAGSGPGLRAEMLDAMRVIQLVA
jgi:hypothetical protein